jgi:hypothetical protein
MNQAIRGFHLDDENHWVANLGCGHQQHMRHDPPLVSRPWVLTPEGRESRLGNPVECKRCDELGAAIAEAVRTACIATLQEAFEDGGIRGLCAEGRIELARDRLRALALEPIARETIRRLTEDWDPSAAPERRP